MASAKKRLSTVQRFACLGITGVICTTPTGAMEALTGLPLLDLLIQGEARSVSGTSPLEFGVLVLHSHQLWT
jgi:hypothetical protein